MKKAISFILTFALCVALLASTALGASTDSGEWDLEQFGQAGGKVFWEISDDGILTISGSGNLSDQVISATAAAFGTPWWSKKEKVTALVYESGITGVDIFSFQGSSVLKSVRIAGTVSVVEQVAFLDCSALENVTLEEGISAVGSATFGSCTGLKQIALPDSLVEIQWSAFSSCSSLKEISLPAGLSCIRERAFNGCDSLTDVYFGGTEAQWNAITIEEGNECLTNATIHFASSEAESPSPAAPVVQLSPQNLTVNGAAKDVEKYNIDGSNYFKLRDIAYLLNGTGSQFSVGWDEATGTVSITTGEAYAPNGSEMIVGADKSATAQASAQTIRINGEVRSDLSVYNLDGNNFFKLRDLGDALGFTVEYDAATNTAIIVSK